MSIWCILCRLDTWLYSMRQGGDMIMYNMHLTNVEIWHVLISCYYDDVIRWKYFLRSWPFFRAIHRLFETPSRLLWRHCNAWITYAVTIIPNNGVIDCRSYVMKLDLIVILIGPYGLWGLIYRKELYLFAIEKSLREGGVVEYTYKIQK